MLICAFSCSELIQYQRLTVQFNTFLSSLQEEFTALMVASKGGHVNVVDVLLKHKAQVDLRNNVSSLCRSSYNVFHVLVSCDFNMISR